MPLYEYECQSCGSVSEVIQRMSDAPLSTCDRCGGELKKLLSAPAFQFKGSGWYVTDYANKSGGNGSEGDTGGAASKATDGSGDSSKSESTGSAAASKSEAKTKSERVASD